MPTAEPTTRVGPQDHGRRMSLEDFLDAEAQPGYVYELEGGVIAVDRPGLPHEEVVDALPLQVAAWRLANPRGVRLGAFGSKVVAPGARSERHPDLALYLTPAPDPVQPWEKWGPDIVVEVVSESSRKRDHEIKRREYLAVGVREYWIVDPGRRAVVVLERFGDQFRERTVADAYETGYLPGFKLEVARLFQP